MENKQNVQDLKVMRDVLQALADSSLDLDSSDISLLTSVSKYLEDKKADYSHLDVFYGLDYSMDKIKHYLLGKHKIEDPKLQDIYIHYQDSVNLLSGFFKNQEGLPCCYDKASSLMHLYYRQRSGLKVPEMDHKKYYYPSNGTTRDWLSFTDAIYHLSCGSLKKYDEEREKVLALYPDDGSNAKVFRGNEMALKLVGKVIQEVEHCENYMDKSKYLFQEFEHALDYMDILDMDTELDNAPNKGDFYLWFDLVNSANELCTSGVTTNFEKSKQNVLKTYQNK